VRYAFACDEICWEKKKKKKRFQKCAA